MDRRLPARVLALLALVGVSVALYTVVSGGEAGTETGTPASESSSAAKEASAGEEDAPRRSRRRRYTVRAGDTPSGIAEKTGVSVERLLELNPDLDAQALQTGQRLRLR